MVYLGAGTIVGTDVSHHLATSCGRLLYCLDKVWLTHTLNKQDVILIVDFLLLVLIVSKFKIEQS